MNIKLSKRLQVIYNLISKKRVADIGSDHGKVLAKALIEKKVDYAVFSDISEPSVNKVSKLLVDEKYHLRVGDGLQTINESDKIEQVIISGLGGAQIIDILTNSKKVFSSYIIQPQNNELALKEYLVQFGYNIVFDLVIYDSGKFYNIIKCDKPKGKSHTEKDASRAELEYFGKDNFAPDNPYIQDFLKYLSYLELKTNNVLIKNNTNEKFLDLKAQIEKAKKKLGVLYE